MVHIGLRLWPFKIRASGSRHHFLRGPRGNRALDIIVKKLRILAQVPLIGPTSFQSYNHPHHLPWMITWCGGSKTALVLALQLWMFSLPQSVQIRFHSILGPFSVVNVVGVAKIHHRCKLVNCFQKLDQNTPHP